MQNAHAVALPIGISARQQDSPEGYAPGWPQSPAAAALRELQQVSDAQLADDDAELFAVLLAMPQDELVRLLAVCVASMVDVVVSSREHDAPDKVPAQAVGLDMAARWKPTAVDYFDHMSKAKSLEPVQVFAPDEVNRLAKLKKAQIAPEAGQLAVESGWLPLMFRMPGRK